MKRALDITASGVLLVLLSPLLLWTAMALLVRQGSPVLFRQERMGRRGRPFLILKFRTMRPEQPGDAQVTSGQTDNRITPLGRFLRRHRLDEFPQLWNVLRGDMSLVGPRPEVPRYVDLHDDTWKTVLSVRPGITGPDALQFKNEGLELAASTDPEAHYRNVLLPAKLAVQAEYAQSRSWTGDLRILFRTLGALRG